MKKEKKVCDMCVCVCKRRNGGSVMEFGRLLRMTPGLASKGYFWTLWARFGPLGLSGHVSGLFVDDYGMCRSVFSIISIIIEFVSHVSAVSMVS